MANKNRRFDSHISLPRDGDQDQHRTRKRTYGESEINIKAKILKLK